jgi:Tol biopolymer transport system component
LTISTPQRSPDLDELEALFEEARRRARRRRRRRFGAALGCALLAAIVLYALFGVGGHDPAGARKESTVAAAPQPPADAIVFDLASSDGLGARSSLAYVPAHGGPVVSLKASPHRAKVATEPRWLTDGGRSRRRTMIAAEPRWSPHGTRIAFVMSPRGFLTRTAGDGDIYVMNANGTDVRRLTDKLDASAPAWSPDGSHIVFIKGQGQALAVMRADGSDQHAIAKARGYYESPAWSPLGRSIVYQSSPNGSFDHTAIYTIHPNGTHERRLTPASASVDSPAWSPNGTQIAYSANNQLWVMNADGNHARQLTNCSGQCVFDFAPAWSPDGKHLVFVQQDDGGAARRLYILDLAARTQRSLTPRIRWANSPDWRPK